MPMFTSRKIEAIIERLEIEHNYIMKLAQRIDLLEQRLKQYSTNYDNILKDTQERLHDLEEKSK